MSRSVRPRLALLPADDRVDTWLPRSFEGDVPDAAGDVLSEAGVLLLARVGGASGVLYGSAFQAIGRELPTAEVDPHRFADALDAGLAVIVELGAAATGDKTMVDAFAPALAAFRGSCDDAECLRRTTSVAATAAQVGAESTIPLLARKGRASYLGHRSIGYMDLGAASTELLFRSLACVTSSVPMYA
ncbi:DAK2 domain-containing protein [Streptomyces sp. O3]